MLTLREKTTTTRVGDIIPFPALKPYEIVQSERGSAPCYGCITDAKTPFFFEKEKEPDFGRGENSSKRVLKFLRKLLDVPSSEFSYNMQGYVYCVDAQLIHNPGTKFG